MFSADRVQSSPCIMQTDHPEPKGRHSTVHSFEEEQAQLGVQNEFIRGLTNARDSMQAGSRCLPSFGTVSLQPSRLSSETQLPEMAAPHCHALVTTGLGQLTAEPSSLSLAHSMLLQSSSGLGTACEYGLQRGAGLDTHMASDCQQLEQPACQERLNCQDAWDIDQEMVCSSSSARAVEAAAAAATLPSLTATSSPCSTFQLPVALSQGIADSPALSGDSSSGDSSRRKSFSPLESGPVSLLPMVENPQIGLPSVSCSTLAHFIDQQPGSSLTDLKIIDCR